MQTSRYKLAFIHIMRTSGFYTTTQMRRSGYNVLDSWHDQLHRDWSPEEAMQLAKEHRKSKSPVMFHNHVVNWNTGLLNYFQENGWVAFTIIRHTGDQLCSLYHFCLNKTKSIPSLDEFMSIQLSGGKVGGIDYEHWQIPDYWEDINSIVLHRQNMFPVLSQEFQIERPIPTRQNSTENKGYHHYLREGVVSLETHKMLLDSSHYQRFLKAKSRCNYSC